VLEKAAEIILAEKLLNQCCHLFFFSWITVNRLIVFKIVENYTPKISRFVNLHKKFRKINKFSSIISENSDFNWNKPSFFEVLSFDAFSHFQGFVSLVLWYTHGQQRCKMTPHCKLAKTKIDKSLASILCDHYLSAVHEYTKGHKSLKTRKCIKT
jgi:hypothetical protein